MIPLAILCVLLIAVIVYQQHSNIIREDAWRLERTALLQRIQAPEVAVYEQGKRETKRVPVVTYDGDASFHEAKRLINGDGN